jgi:hypothetical protein
MYNIKRIGLNPYPFIFVAKEIVFFVHKNKTLNFILIGGR